MYGLLQWEIQCAPWQLLAGWQHSTDMLFHAVLTPTDSAGTSLTSFTFQFAFGLAISNLSCPGLVLTPGSYQAHSVCSVLKLLL